MDHDGREVDLPVLERPFAYHANDVADGLAVIYGLPTRYAAGAHNWPVFDGSPSLCGTDKEQENIITDVGGYLQFRLPLGIVTPGAPVCGQTVAGAARFGYPSGGVAVGVSSLLVGIARCPPTGASVQ